MPGFNISNNGGPNPKRETLRAHRWTIFTFLNEPVSDDSVLKIAREVQLPERLVDSLSIKTIGATYKFAKQVGYGNLGITWYGTTELVRLLEEKMDEIHTDTSGLGDFNEYMGRIIIGLSTVDEGFDYEFENCYIEKISKDQLNYSSSDIWAITADIALTSYRIL